MDDYRVICSVIDDAEIARSKQDANLTVNNNQYIQQIRTFTISKVVQIAHLIMDILFFWKICDVKKSNSSNDNALKLLESQATIEDDSDEDEIIIERNIDCRILH